MRTAYFIAAAMVCMVALWCAWWRSGNTEVGSDIQFPHVQFCGELTEFDKVVPTCTILW